MRQHRATVLGIGLLVSVGLAGCVGDATKSASDTPASTPIASIGSDTGPPVDEGQPAPPPEADEVQARGVLAFWRIANIFTGDFAGFAATPDVYPLTGDFNGDGRMDVALLRRTAGWGSMPVAFANGDGSWRVANIFIGGDFVGWAATPGVQVLTGDFNGDGRTDVALVNKASGWKTMPVAFANGDGSWRITNSGIGDFAGWVQGPGVIPLTGDFNGDGRMDVALVNKAAGWKTMPVAFADGDGTWRITNSRCGDFAGFAATPGVQVLTGDFNGDKRMDVALVNNDAGWTTMPVAFANGDGSWRITNGDIGYFAGWATAPRAGPLTGDFNGDGRMDVALLNRRAGWTTMPVAFANGDGSWRITNSSIGDFAGWATEDTVLSFTGDFNGDKRMDVALLNRNRADGWSTMPVAFANGDGTWRITNISSGAFAGYAATTGVQVLTGDFINGDKRTDVLLLRQTAGWGSMPVASFHDAVGGTTTTPTTSTSGISVGGTTSTTTTLNTSTSGISLRGVPQEGSPPAEAPPAETPPAETPPAGTPSAP